MGRAREDDQVFLSLLHLRREGRRPRARRPGPAAASGAAPRDERRGPRGGRCIRGTSWFPARRRVMTSLRSILVSCTLVTLVALSPVLSPAQSPPGYSAVTEGRLLNP